MQAHNIFKEYIWLVNTILTEKRITLEEINRKWIRTTMSGGNRLARTTFNRHRIAIEEMFGIYIDCDRKGGYHYHIGNIEVMRQNTIQNWMLSTLSVNEVIGNNMNLKDRILIESSPVNTVHLERILSAMKGKHKLVITYHKYGESLPKDVLIEPYCLKMFKQRWYVVANTPDNIYKIYSLDRIKKLANSSSPFVIDPKFNAQSLFDEYFGILRMDSIECQRVVIRAYGKERYYLRDLPMHHTQKELSECDEYCDFEYTLRPTSDFVSHLLSRASQIQVLSPVWLAEKVRDMAESIVRMYKT